MSQRLLAVIPARAGSKRLPKKNVRELLGVPLMAYTIEAALKSKLFERVVVSTDSSEFADLALRYGAEVPFVRDRNLADDFTMVSDVTLDALNRVDPDGAIFDAVAQLMPNCPLRSATSIIASHKQFVSTGARSQISISKFGWFNPWWAMTRDGSMRMKEFFEGKTKERSQDLAELYCPNGAVWWATCDALRESGTFYSPDYQGWEIALSEGLDIDTEDEWEFAEQLMRGRTVNV